jgi:integrase
MLEIINGNINPHLGHIPLAHLTREMFKDLYAYLLKYGKKERPIGRVIKSLREERKMTRGELGKKLDNIMAKDVESLETGKDVPGKKDIEKIAKALGVHEDKLLKRHQGLSPRTVRYVHTIIKAALSDAAESDLIPKNPVARLKPPKDKRKQKEKMTVLDEEQLDKFLIDAMNDSWAQRDYVLIHLGAMSGARESEMLGLDIDDSILWERKAIKIENTLHRDEDAIDGFERRPRTKNETSTRIVDLDDETMEYLAEQVRRQKEKHEALGIKENLLFTEPDGRPISADNLGHRFGNLAKRLGHPGFTFHDLRHTHATILLLNGAYIKEVSERLGHANVLVTLSTYAHVLEGKKTNLGTRFAGLVRKKVA